MTKSEQIIEIISKKGHVDFNSIHKIVGCSHALVNSVCTSGGARDAAKRKRSKPQREVNPGSSIHKFKFKTDMQVLIEDDTELWTVDAVGRSFLQLVRGCDKKNVLKDRIVKVVA